MERGLKVSRANPVVKKLLALSFPNFKGRKIVCELSDKAYIEPAADGGTYDKVVAIGLQSGEALPLRVVPFSAEHIKLANEPLAIPEGIALVVHSYFCGHDVGIRIYVNPLSLPSHGGSLAGLLPAKAEAF